MPSARSILIASVASVSAQYTTSVSAPSYDQAMPTLSSYGSPQDWQQWNTYNNGGWSPSSSATAVSSYATSAAPVYSSGLSTHLPVPVSTSAYGSASAYASTPVYGASSAVSSASSAPYENPFTVYLSQTNSLGVVTGMPSVVTSQPVAVTSQPAVATTPAGYVPISAPANTTTTLVTSARPSNSTPTSSGSFNQNPSGTTSSRLGTSTGAGAKDSVTGAGLALVIAGMAFSLL